ncbi:hypothetical protein GQ44DRAFT_721115 [Phaeosphaeriaceae sp. PMI808]|nr:hypothetical protein GQ44DRAFT_721115 [Phaeosphaeriaceae sp. PMI808]
MSAAETTRRLRKACMPCIRAKAKCSPSVQRLDECHRCARLSKQCVFEVMAKKPGPGPKSRSRVRQLEQRVESLIDLIASKNDIENLHDDAVPIQAITPESNVPTGPAFLDPSKDLAPTPKVEAPPFPFYDPVDAGILGEQHAYRLVREFETSFLLSFPFVVLDVDGPTLRRQNPFLFHAILAVTAYDTPKIQYQLSEELRCQVARTIEYSHKSFGLLQGLLVYVAWYHTFYHPANQQIAIMIQLCVALVQDLGLSKNSKAKPAKWNLPCDIVPGRSKGTPLSEKRAYLGTFFVTVAFAQAWRKPATLRYTRHMSQCCDAFIESSVPTDVLIHPMIQTSELLSRVNDQFSYDDIENADVKGELLIGMSTTSFLAELKCIRESTLSSALLQHNTTLSLMFLLLDMVINEVCLHTSLWCTSSTQTTPPLSINRLKMLHRSIESATSYVKILAQSPQSVLYQLGLGSWSAWFYAVIILCKLVFLQENERLGCTNFEDLPGELVNLQPRDIEASSRNDTGPESCPDETGWSALTIAREYKIYELFNGFAEKLRFTLPMGSGIWQKSKEEQDSLYAIACLQRTMLQGFAKRIDRITPKFANSTLGNQLSVAPLATASSSSKRIWQPTQPALGNNELMRNGSIGLPFAPLLNFDSMNFDGVPFPTASISPQAGEDPFGDFMWNMAMDDFSLPMFGMS